MPNARRTVREKKCDEKAKVRKIGRKNILENYQSVNESKKGAELHTYVIQRDQGIIVARGGNCVNRYANLYSFRTSKNCPKD